MSQETINLFISIDAGSNVDDEQLDDLARQLSDELAELDTISSELARGDKLPAGVKGIPIEIGTILARIAGASGVTGLITILGSWLSRDERRKVTLQIGENKLEVMGISETEQTDLIRWFQTQTGLRLES